MADILGKLIFFLNSCFALNKQIAIIYAGCTSSRGISVYK